MKKTSVENIFFGLEYNYVLTQLKEKYERLENITIIENKIEFEKDLDYDVKLAKAILNFGQQSKFAFYFVIAFNDNDFTIKDILNLKIIIEKIDYNEFDTEQDKPLFSTKAILVGGVNNDILKLAELGINKFTFFAYNLTPTLTLI